MKIGFGVPNPMPGVPGHTLLHLARRAEERGFSGLATIDRIAYPSYDSLTTLAAAAGATSRIELITNILLAPLYPTPHLARTAASIDQLSGGRLTLGMAPGARRDDFALTGSEFGQRGRVFDGQLEALNKVWRGEWPLEGPSGPPVGPTPVHDNVPVLIGGTSEAALRRVITWGAGWTAGGGGPQMAAEFAGRVRTAWADAGREGEPRIAALAYFSLGDELVEESRGYLLDYYGFLGSWGGTYRRFGLAHSTGDPRRNHGVHRRRLHGALPRLHHVRT